MALAPAIPSNLSVQQGNGQVLISWQIVPGALAYIISRSTNGIDYSTLVTNFSASYVDDSVTAGTMYWYKVASNSSGGDVSSYCTPVQVVPAPAGQLSLYELRLRSQQRADRVNSQFVTTEEWNSYINQSYFELYDLLVQKYGNDYFVAAPLQFTTDGSTLYDLPNGTNYTGAAPFYKLLGVDLGIDAGNNAWITLKRFNFISRNRYVYPQLTTNALGVAGLRYRLVGSQLELIPTPAAGQTVQLWYVPRLTTLLQDTDIADGVSGWLEYVIVDAAIKALQKEESDCSLLLAQKAALMDRIEAAAENRDAGEPETVSDTRTWTGSWGNGMGDGPNGGW